MAPHQCKAVAITAPLHAFTSAELLTHGFGVALGRSNPRAHGCSAKGNGAQFQEPLLEPFGSTAQLSGPATHLLPHRERNGVLKMGAANLDHIGPGRGFALESLHQLLQGRDQTLALLPLRCQMNRTREHVVRALAAVDVVIGVNHLAGAPWLAR